MSEESIFIKNTPGVQGKVKTQTPSIPETPKNLHEPTTFDGLKKYIEPENTSNTDSFYKTISVPRQDIPEPPNPNQTTNETPGVENEQSSTTAEPTSESEKAPISKAGIEVTAEFYTDTGDLIIPKILAWVNKTADEKQYELKPKQKQYIVDSWVRLLEEKQHQLTPAQQLVSAYFGGYGTEMILLVISRLMEAFNSENKQAKQNTTVIEPKQNEAPAPQPQQSQAAPQQPAQNTQEPSAEPQAPQPKEPAVVLEPGTQQPIPQNTSFKPCANKDCSRTFAPGEGFAKSKKSKFYDTTCSKPCMSKVIGATGGANKKNN